MWISAICGRCEVWGRLRARADVIVRNSDDRLRGNAPEKNMPQRGGPIRVA